MDVELGAQAGDGEMRNGGCAAWWGRRRGTSREGGEDDALLRPLQEDGDDYRGACCVEVLHGGGSRDGRAKERGIKALP